MSTWFLTESRKGVPRRGCLEPSQSHTYQVEEFGRLRGMRLMNRLP